METLFTHPKIFYIFIGEKINYRKKGAMKVNTNSFSEKHPD